MRTTTTYRLLAAIVLALAVSTAGEAQTRERGKIVTNAQMIGMGTTDILDTYISPEKYHGTEVRYLSHTVRQRLPQPPGDTLRRSRMTTWRSHLTTELIHQGYLSYSENRAGEGTGIAGMYSFSYGVHHNWQPGGGAWHVKAGVQVDANLGFLYNTRNGNNPAQARVSIDLAPSAAADYRFRLGRQSMAVGYEVSVPLVGLLFCPNYGQSYYEIFNEGNYDHNIVATTIGTAPCLRQMLTVDIHLRHSAIRVGYVGDVEQYKVNNLKYHNYSHLFMLGYVRRFQSIKLKP